VANALLIARSASLRKAAAANITVASRSLGAIDVDTQDVVDFVAPIAGFADAVRYALLPHTPLTSADAVSVAWLQCLDAPFHAFVVTDPWLIAPDYAPEIADSDADDLGLDSFHEARVLAILTIPGDPTDISINLRAPIVVNAAQRRAKQVVLLGDEYSTRHPVGRS
jgi:flagellar assembly factor FliW